MFVSFQNPGMAITLSLHLIALSSFDYPTIMSEIYMSVFTENGDSAFISLRIYLICFAHVTSFLFLFFFLQTFCAFVCLLGFYSLAHDMFPIDLKNSKVHAYSVRHLL